MPRYPRPLPATPSAFGPAPWIVKVNPSAAAASSRKLNVVVKFAASTGRLKKALPASLAAPSVRASVEPLILAEPFNVTKLAAWAKPPSRWNCNKVIGPNGADTLVGSENEDPPALLNARTRKV